MANSYLPDTDTGLMLWANSVSEQITPAPTDFGLTAPIAASFAAAALAYSDALGVATSEVTRTKGTVAAKNTARAVLREEARKVAALVQAHPGITDQQLEDLHLTVRDREPTVQPPPALAPLCQLLSVTGRVGKYKLADATAPASRRRPPNAAGATILMYVGETPPPSTDPGWKLAGQTGKNVFLVEFPASVQPGTPCWVTALWYNARGQYSPACPPVQTFLQAGPIAEAA